MDTVTDLLSIGLLWNTAFPVYMKECAEAIAGCLILGRRPEHRKTVAVGIVIGVVASVSIGLLLHFLVQDADKAWSWFEGGVAIFAAYFLLGVAAYHLCRPPGWMPKSKGMIARNVGRPVAFLQVAQRSELSLVLTITLVLREGLEFTIFSTHSSAKDVISAVLLGSLYLVIPVVLLRKKLMNEEFTNPLNWTLVVLGAWIIWGAHKSAHEKNWPGWLLPLFAAIYILLSAWVYVLWQRRRTRKSYLHLVDHRDGQG